MAELMTIKGFDAHEQWSVFAAEYAKNGGVMNTACEVAGFHRDTAARMKRANPNFVLWLAEIVNRKMSSAMNKADLRLAAKVAKGEGVESKLLKTQDQLYRRNEKIQNKIEIHNTTTVHSGESLPEDVMRDVLRWAAENPDRVEQLMIPSRN